MGRVWAFALCVILALGLLVWAVLPHHYPPDSSISTVTPSSAPILILSFGVVTAGTLFYRRMRP
jgi:polyferredoxin